MPNRKPASDPKVFDPPDFMAVFNASPNPYLILDPEFTIVGVNDAYCRATMLKRENMLGYGIFDIFPDNPDDRETRGTGNLNTSLMRVLEYARPDAMAVQKYDIRRPAEEGGQFEVRYWSPLNLPVCDAAGKVRWIIHYAEDVTAAMLQRALDTEREVFAREQQRLIDQLRAANLELSRNMPPPKG